MNKLYSKKGLDIYIKEKHGSALIVSFSGVGPYLGSTQKPEFSNTLNLANNVYTEMYVIDRDRSFYTGGKSIEIKKIIESFCSQNDINKCYLTGHSMGAYGAIITALQLEVTSFVLAFSPFYSFSSKVIPEDTRCAEYKRAINRFDIPEISSFTNPLIKKCTIYYGDTNPMDFYHEEKYKEVINSNQKYWEIIKLNGCGHNTPKCLKNDSNKLVKVFQSFLSY